MNTTQQQTKQLTCSQCGITSPDVRNETAYVGGYGNVTLPYCADIQACWKRWHKKYE